MRGIRLFSPSVLWKRVPLAGKALLVTLLAGSAVWMAADQRASRSLESMIRHDRETQLQIRLRTDRIRFDRRLRAFSQAATVFAERAALQSLVGGWQGRGPGPPGPVVYHGVPPSWLPPRAVLSALVGPVYALLLTPDGRTRKAYQSRARNLPPALLHASADLLRGASREDGAIAVLDGTPFLITARPVTDPSGRVLATLVLALPVGVVLNRVVQEDSPGRGLLAFLSVDGTQVLASSRPTVLAPGTARSALRGRFLVAGAVPGAGASAEPAERLIRVARADVPEALIGRILAQARDQRLLMALVFVLVFGLLLLWITYRIRALHLRIGEFSRRVGLRRTDEDGAGGDEFRLIEHGFQQLMEHVLDETSNLEYQAQHDALTRLPNRVLLYDRLEQAVLGSARDHRCFSLMMMDLDRFKEINDTLGHHIGDLMLKQVG
ncbi:MAG TPA: GGDEF domain-containing protein, partial [Chromatiales bacterium]|nr:GGDEF domain-containing protein [Chromatiales bacterium]